MSAAKAFVTGLPAATKTALTARSNAAGLWHLGGHLGAVLLCGGLIALGYLWLVPVQGVLIVFLFTLEHEATHKTPFANTAMNEAVGRACGFLLLLPFGWFRSFHLAHHRWTNIPGKDPELAGDTPESLRAWVWHISGLPYWISETRLLIRLCMGRERADYLPTNALPRMQAEARWMALGYGCVAVSLLATPLLFWVWLLPVLVGQPALRLYLMAEHGDCPRVTNMFENTRTTYTTALLRFLAWNMPYHTEHHVMPAVPFHHLPTLHLLMKDQLAMTAPGYRKFTTEYLRRRL